MLAAWSLPEPLDGDSLLDQIGNTPLVRLGRSVADLPGVEIWLKLEFFNPGGSVKDRPARGIIMDAERSGRLSWTPRAGIRESPMRQSPRHEATK